MDFNQTLYRAELLEMARRALSRLRSEYPEYEIFALNIWTDANAGHSALSVENKSNSDAVTERGREWHRKQYQRHLANGDTEQAALFEDYPDRNFNPADFDMPEFEVVAHRQFPAEWESNSDGACWEVLEPILQEVGDWLFQEAATLRCHPDFELSVCGGEDWYQFVWVKNTD
jgi:hypothetical protein